MTRADYDVVVIGAGPNGLAAAATLAKAGRKVLVLERADAIGGHTRAIEFAPGFRSPLNEDAGWVPAKVAAALDAASDEVARADRGIDLSVARDDGSLWSLRPQHATRSAESVRQLSQRDAARWPAFVERMRKFAGVLAALYQLPPPDIDTTSPGEILPLLGVGGRVRSLGRADLTEFLRVMPMSIQDLLDDTFESETLKAGIASAAVRDLQQGPRSGGTTYNLLHYMAGADHMIHARWYAREGPDAFAHRFADVCRTRGVEIRTGVGVRHVMISEYGVRGVITEAGEEIRSQVVLSTADPRRTLLEFVDPVWLDPDFVLAVRNIKLRGCTAYAFYALDRLDDADRTFVGPVCLTGDTTALEQAADAAKYGEIPAQPHVEFFSPTSRWPSLAPEGKHVVAARVQYAPYRLRSGAWTPKDAADLEKRAAAAIARVIPGFESTILHRALLSPADVERQFGVTEGALTQGEMMLDQLLFMRPVAGWGRYAMPVGGLYLGGAGAHPGHGVLGGAGWLAAREVLRAR